MTTRDAVLAAVTIAAMALGSSVEASLDRTRSYSATAFSLEDDRPLYVERHIEVWRGGDLVERRVRYEEPGGALIADKVVRYGDSPHAPSFAMRDHRIGLIEGAEVGPEEVLLFSDPTGEPRSSLAVQKPEDAVIDAGFDAFMRSNFNSIAAGRKLEFDFAVPAARRFFRFELVPQGEVEYGGRRAELVMMRPASLLLRLAIDPIELVYSPDGRLLEFRGLANVCDTNGDRYRARIVFDYGTSGLTALEVGAAR